VPKWRTEEREKKGMREVRTVHKWEKNSELKEREKMG
jgi:hypothetical protein